MFRPSRTGGIIISVMVVFCTATAAAAPPNADTLRAGLRTANPAEEAYLTYIATLAEQGRLPTDMVESTFLWARRRPDPKKFQYFKFALITRAGELGITLPQQTPALTGTIRGRVRTRILLIDVPASDVTVTLEGTPRKAITDSKGEFTFRDVPFGRYTLRAKGGVALLSRAASAEVVLPSPPPSTKPVFVTLELK